MRTTVRVAIIADIPRDTSKKRVGFFAAFPNPTYWTSSSDG